MVRGRASDVCPRQAPRAPAERRPTHAPRVGEGRLGVAVVLRTCSHNKGSPCAADASWSCRKMGGGHLQAGAISGAPCRAIRGGSPIRDAAPRPAAGLPRVWPDRSRRTLQWPHCSQQPTSRIQRG